MALNFGDILDAVSAHRGDAPAVSDDRRSLTWREFDARSNALARGLAQAGIAQHDHVAFMLFNGVEYLELLAACFKARFVHVNVNFRYTSSEVAYVIGNSDAVCLVYDRRLQEVIDGLPDELRSRLLLVATGDDYEALIAGQASGPLGIERSPQDEIFVYTGGTTGMPKGVVWAQTAQAHVLLASAYGDRDLSLADIVEQIDAPRLTMTPLIASPLMHGLGLVTALTGFANGAHIVVTDNAGRFDADWHWSLVERHRADSIAIVGDAFATPLLAALEAGKYDASTIRVIGSSGVMWSMESKRALLAAMPQAAMFDALASSEAMGIGSSLMTASGDVPVAAFKVGPDTRVFAEDGTEIAPGSGRAGLLARGGHLPKGYYKDPEKTAETFRVFGGRRYSVPGDMATVDADGTITLLGRGNQCINTGGEKVFPEEVEQAIKHHPHVADALVFGMPDPKWGQAINAVVRPAPGATLDRDSLNTMLRGSLAGYKLPKVLVVSERDLRMANGKPDYKLARETIAELAAGEG